MIRPAASHSDVCLIACFLKERSFRSQNTIACCCRFLPVGLSVLICPALPQPLTRVCITVARSGKRLQRGRPPVFQKSFGLGFRLVGLAAVQDCLLLQTAAQRISYECGSGAGSAVVRGRLTKAMVRLKYATLTEKTVWSVPSPFRRPC